MLLDVLKTIHIVGMLQSEQRAGNLVFASEVILAETASIISIVLLASLEL